MKKDCLVIESRGSLFKWMEGGDAGVSFYV